MRTLGSPINAAGAFAIVVLASPAANGQGGSADLEFQGAASAELLEVFKTPCVDALYEISNSRSLGRAQLSSP
jgi:hypothetical protein